MSYANCIVSQVNSDGQEQYSETERPSYPEAYCGSQQAQDVPHKKGSSCPPGYLP